MDVEGSEEEGHMMPRCLLTPSNKQRRKKVWGPGRGPQLIRCDGVQ